MSDIQEDCMASFIRFQHNLPSDMHTSGKLELARQFQMKLQSLAVATRPGVKYHQLADLSASMKRRLSEIRWHELDDPTLIMELQEWCALYLSANALPEDLQEGTDACA